ncbi:hypothetical protein F4804DRAFT_323981 [Jackrogersella minutella]|nr:hypothetical protein F4804DRAFT_323981 [Jackrogersella minutella]
MQVRINYIHFFIHAVWLFAICSARVFPLVRDNSDDQYPKTILGPDGEDTATIEYKINHLALNVRNLTRSIEFYTQTFGMRWMETTYFTQHYSTSFLGYSSAGKNGTGYETTAELNRNVLNSQGYLELIYLDVPETEIPSSTESTNTFSHFCFVVPDAKLVQNRLDSFNVTIYKRIGELIPCEGPFNRAINLNESIIDPVEFSQIRQRLSEVANGSIFASDPDGNLLEILPQK